jgi:hypothetical protein
MTTTWDNAPDDDTDLDYYDTPEGNVFDPSRPVVPADNRNPNKQQNAGESRSDHFNSGYADARN